MSIEESHFWADFLSNRGSLTLFADTLSENEHVYKADLPDYVGFKSKHLDTQVDKIIGSQKDLISEGQILNIDSSKKRIKSFLEPAPELMSSTKVKMEQLPVLSSRLVILE